MPVHDFAAQRLFVDAPLMRGARVACTAEQANYLLAVLRLKAGDSLLIFNGRDGEWRARVVEAGKRDCRLEAEALVRAQEAGPDIDYLFAPLKRARLDYMVQKATEMGVRRLRPVLTRRTVAERINLERMRANVIEAAEQCGFLRLPEVHEPEKLLAVLATWDAARPLVFCDEAAETKNPLDMLQTALKRVPDPGGQPQSGQGLPVAILIGPEGGFDTEERSALLAKPFTVAVSLGPRILRADTAAIAALALVNATVGDWR
jgi:16S rRNA (uracil1498-N3)-methyltransferase